MITFNWTNPNPEDRALFYRLYADGELYVDDIGELKFSLTENMTGEVEFYVTAVDSKTKAESVPSNAVVANFTSPAAPVLSISYDD